MTITMIILQTTYLSERAATVCGQWLRADRDDTTLRVRVIRFVKKLNNSRVYYEQTAPVWRTKRDE